MTRRAGEREKEKMTEKRLKYTENVWFHVTKSTQGVEKNKGLEPCWRDMDFSYSLFPAFSL